MKNDNFATEDFNNSFDVEKEKFVLGAMLLKDGAIIPDVAAILDSDDFYRPEHRLIYQVILKIVADKKPVTALSLFEELRLTTDQQGKSLMDKIGIDYIFGIMEFAHTTAYAEPYARDIKEKSELRRLIHTAQQITEDAIIGFKSPLEIIADAQNAFANFKETSGEKFFNVAEYVTVEFLRRAELQKQFADRKSNFYYLDKFQYWKPGLYILGATPAAGKTTFCWQLLEQFAEKKENCIFCSYEMDTQSLIAKTIARRLFQYYDTATTSTQLQFGNTPPSYRDMAQMLLYKKPNFTVRKFTDENVDKLLTILRQQVKELGKFDKPPIICIDYIQRLIDRNATADRRALLDDALFKLKDFSTETNSIILGVSTFNRANYNTPPSFENFKESGCVEYTADVIFAMTLNIANKLYGEKENVIRQKINAAKLEQPREINLKCLKNRFGNNYDCFFKYHSAHDYFDNCEEIDFIGCSTSTDESKDTL